jgi:hypothetical protein
MGPSSGSSDTFNVSYYFQVRYKALFFDLIFTSGHILCWLLTKCISIPWERLLEGWNTKECFSVNKVVFTYISALVGFLCKIVSSVHGYGKDKVQECYMFFRQPVQAALWSTLFYSIGCYVEQWVKNWEECGRTLWWHNLKYYSGSYLTRDWGRPRKHTTVNVHLEPEVLQLKTNRSAGDKISTFGTTTWTLHMFLEPRYGV